jgi:uncharacterized protein YijF (DUF1287 family)
MKRKIILSIIGVLIIVFSLLIFEFFGTGLKKKYVNADFGFETYISESDLDQDGIDDQSDILKSAREYIAKKPQYKSKYYGSGYPDDEYGVCTDVVAFALLGAGYDLMTLVNVDVKNNRDQYPIEIVDKKIDFRRVGNLKIYLDRNAISLTTSLDDLEAWQGGDIVVFKRHIGIVSDKRNKKGIPYIIHHANPAQMFYEEDILERSNDIVGHYRISK